MRRSRRGRRGVLSPAGWAALLVALACAACVVLGAVALVRHLQAEASKPFPVKNMLDYMGSIRYSAKEQLK